MELYDFIFKFRALGEWVEKTTDDLFKDKKIVMFGLPGAFTPTCSTKQLPAYEREWHRFREKGIDDIYCISVNDAFVMNAWAEDLNIKNIKLIPDGTGAFTRSLNMLVNKPAQGFGLRSWRYSVLVNNKKIIDMFVEPGMNNLSSDDDPYVVSDPETILKQIDLNATIGK